MSVLREVLLTRWQWRVIILFSSFIASVFGLMGPYFQKEFIDGLLKQDNSILYFIFYAFICILLSQLFSQLTNYLGARESILMQRRLSDRLYDKMLQLRVDTMSSRPIGEVVQLYATDVPGSTVFLDQTLPSGASTLFPLLLAPFAISMMFDMPLWPTVAMMVLVSTINTSLAFRQSKFFYRFKQLAGERIGLVNEWIQNIRTIRILGWTHHFEKNIFKKRIIETKNRVGMVTNGQFMNSISSSVTFILNVLTLGTLVFYTKHELTSGQLMALLWILGVFLTRPFRQMPWFFTFTFDSWTSIKRLQDFLDTVESESHKKSENSEPDNQYAIDIENLNLEINKNKVLRNINLKVKPGEFVAVVGEVGCGKSMLLLSLLRETGANFNHYHLLSHNANQLSDDELRSHFAFVPQEGFIMSASLRENVGFLYDLDHTHDTKLLQSLKASQFDLTQEKVEKGLETEIGERGVNLSGGQKQRVSLARVHYHQAPILLLDDCLSAVDVETEHKLLESLFLGDWKNRTKILATHRLTVLDHVDRILFMENGEIIDQGNYQELHDRNEKFRQFTFSVERNLSEISQVHHVIKESEHVSSEK